MRKTSVMKIMATLFAFLFLTGITGAYALWVYPSPDIETGVGQVGIGMEIFNYAPEDVLPDEEEDSQAQQNHMDIVQELLFNDKMGLNGGKNALESAVKQRGLLHYLENIQGGNLKHLIDTTDGGKNLGFVLQYIDETQFYGYTFYRINQTIGARIVVYRTLFKRNYDTSIDVDKDGDMDDWIAHSSISGTAVTVALSGNQCGILTDTWQSTYIDI